MQLSSNISQGESTSTIMNYVLLALIPGFASQVYFFGNAYLFNLGVALTANFMVCLAIAQSGSQGRLKDLIADNSNWLTCALIAIALPPGMPVWVIGVAVASGLGLGKYAYGGLGQNVFNPAMVGYAIVLISFPEHLALWPELIDGVTSATPLELLKYNSGLTAQELNSTPSFGVLAGVGWEWVNIAYLAGGIALLILRVVSWHIPLSMLFSIVLLSGMWYDMGSSQSLGSPLVHLLSGGTMLAAFFIATDPVTCPATARGKVIFGVVAGTMVFVIRSWGVYPDGIAFAVLLANLGSPFIDHMQVKNAR